MIINWGWKTKGNIYNHHTKQINNKNTLSVLFYYNSKMGQIGQKVQTCSYKINKSWGHNVHMLSIVNDTVLYQKSLKEWVLIALTTGKIICNYVSWCMLTRLTVIIL